MTTSSNNTHINSEQVLITPQALRAELPLSDSGRQFVLQSRKTISDIVHKRDPRLLVISGPCSIHDVEAAKDYARQLKVLQEQYQDSLFVVMRVYFEKPRTTVGWKGLINDPHMDDSFDIETGLRKARELILYLTELGLPLATEALDPISPQYLAEVFSWSAIGARTTESQTHREMASGLSMPIGFKNGTNGSLGVAVNALQSAAHPHRFMGINREGQVALIQTDGNPDGHVILRGGTAPNYDADSIAKCESALAKQGVDAGIIVDCSHGNSNKDYTRQPIVAQDVVAQICGGNKSIIGIMLESNINAGNQSSNLAKEDLAYGVSVTDACIDFAETAQLLADMDASLSGRLSKRVA
ncbi:3-deoxy-7-phosphoheptulonate synthase [Colwellia sp. E2M01]|uniref:3-deoxy-7-phosphoheptulonate synthase n=1 Tax=Colwellia sp. E2M01 TaxID=2841561 RepID=UPI001C0991D1|nr:3-deoxy-7-phosphoheptulonate synthase [Colwellia sp. E2M01]MBU2869170.1 3-deoxy-7-phosphoheptulonate synthase [Colwellia sp. E2M01]